MPGETRPYTLMHTHAPTEPASQSIQVLLGETGLPFRLTHGDSRMASLSLVRPQPISDSPRIYTSVFL